ATARRQPGTVLPGIRERSLLRLQPARSEAVAERDRQLVGSGNDGGREGPVRRHKSLLGIRLYRGSEEDRRADPRPARRRRPDRPDRRFGATVLEAAKEGDSQGPPGGPAWHVYDTRRRGQSRASRLHRGR